MTRYLRIKVTLAAIGILLLIWGLRFEDETIRWVAIGVLAVAVLIRFVPRRLRNGDGPPPDETR